MSPSHYAWLRYEDLQQRSKKLQNFNGYAWGIESGLNYLLGAIEAGTFPSDLAELDAAVNRAIATGARLWRSRALALRTWATPPESSATTAGAADAIIEFARIARTVKKADEEIREHVHHIKPARTAGNPTISVTAGQIQSEMKLTNRLPAVCSAIGSLRFESTYRVKVRPVSVPLNSSTTTFTIEVQETPRTACVLSNRT